MVLVDSRAMSTPDAASWLAQQRVAPKRMTLVMRLGQHLQRSHRAHTHSKRLAVLTDAVEDPGHGPAGELLIVLADVGPDRLFPILQRNSGWTKGHATFVPEHTWSVLCDLQPWCPTSFLWSSPGKQWKLEWNQEKGRKKKASEDKA